MRSNVRRAFTLIEVLVVVAIIALLLAILLPSLSRAREQTRSLACKSNQKQLMLSTLLYIQDYKVLPATVSLFHINSLMGVSGVYPMPRVTDLRKKNWTWDGADLSGDYQSAGSGGNPAPQPTTAQLANFARDVPRRGTIFKYSKEEKLYLCPSDAPGAPQDTPSGGGGNGRLSYSMNAYIGYKNPDQMYGRDVVQLARGAKMSKKYTADEMFVFVEEHPYYYLNNGYRQGNFNVTDKISTRHLLSISNNAAMTKGRTNIAYLDGHVDSILQTAKADSWYLFMSDPKDPDKTKRRLWMPVPHPDWNNSNDFVKEFVPRLKGPLVP